jgi:hypothetical protein
MEQNAINLVNVKINAVDAQMELAVINLENV